MGAWAAERIRSNQGKQHLEPAPCKLASVFLSPWVVFLGSQGRVGQTWAGREDLQAVGLLGLWALGSTERQNSVTQMDLGIMGWLMTEGGAGVSNQPEEGCVSSHQNLPS